MAATENRRPPRIFRSNGNSRLSKRDRITTLLAAFLLITAIIISIVGKYQIELLAFILLSFCLGLLSFLMIGKIESKEISILGIKITQASGGFMVFILILSCFLGYKKVAGMAKIDSLQSSVDNSVQIEDPRDPKIWAGAKGIFEWFNPPLALAVKEHRQTKTEWFKNQTFELWILLIHGEDSVQNSQFFTPKLKRLVQFVNNLKETYKEDFIPEKHITVKIFSDKYIPSQSFFTTNNWGVKNSPYSIFYLPFKANSERPSKCIVSASKELNETLHTEFYEYWPSATEISIDKLISARITDTLKLTSIKKE